MVKEKKPRIDDIEKLRKILDNPFDPNAVKLISPNDETIDSVRKRLTHTPVIPRTLPSATVSRVSSSLQPTVTIRLRPKPVPVSAAGSSLPVFEPVSSMKSTSAAPLPEFEPVYSAPGAEIPVFTPVTTEDEPLFDTEDLIEIEKVDVTYPEFSAAGSTDETAPPGDMMAKQEEAAPSATQGTAEKELPSWQPVTETPPYEPTVIEEAPSAEEIPEFTRLSPEVPKEPSESPAIAEPVATEGQPKSKEQRRAKEKLERQKQKVAKLQRKRERKQARIDARKKKQEAKQQRKMEREQAQREAQQKEQEALRLSSEQPKASQPPEIPPGEPAPEVEQPPAIKVDLSAFKDIESIDEHIGELLFRNGYFSLDDLRKATIDDLVHIRGVKRKLAKKIKKEVEQIPKAKPEEEFIVYNKKIKPKKSKTEHEDVTEWESFSAGHHEDASVTTPATFRKYTLYKRERGKGARKTTIHFFSKEKPEAGTPVPLPKGYEIAVHKKTKVPYLKKKK